MFRGGCLLHDQEYWVVFNKQACISVSVDYKTKSMPTFGPIYPPYSAGKTKRCSNPEPGARRFLTKSTCHVERNPGAVNRDEVETSPFH